MFDWILETSLQECDLYKSNDRKNVFFEKCMQKYIFVSVNGNGSIGFLDNI